MNFTSKSFTISNCMISALMKEPYACIFDSFAVLWYWVSSTSNSILFAFILLFTIIFNTSNVIILFIRRKYLDLSINSKFALKNYRFGIFTVYIQQKISLFALSLYCMIYLNKILSRDVYNISVKMFS